MIEFWQRHASDTEFWVLLFIWACAGIVVILSVGWSLISTWLWKRENRRIEEAYKPSDTETAQPIEVVNPIRPSVRGRHLKKKK